MINTDDKILNVVIGSMSIEDLENIIKRKKIEVEKNKKMTEEQEYAMRFEEWFKKKLYPPK